MGWLDWLGHIPVIPVLRERLAQAEADLKNRLLREKELESELRESKEQMETLQLYTEKLQSEIQRLTEELVDHESKGRHLSQVEEEILIYVAQGRHIRKAAAKQALGLSVTRFDYHWHRILEFELVAPTSPDSPAYKVTQVGREYLVLNNLVA